MTHPVSLAAVQMQSTAGDKAANMARAEQNIRKAAGDGASIICLPELFLTGYNLSRDAFIKKSETPDGPMADRLRELTRELGVMVIAPFPEKGPEADELFNSALVVCEGEVLGVHRKVYLWGEQEKSIFRAGNSMEVYTSPWGTVGVLLCADAEYPEPPRILALKGAELLFVPSVWSVQARSRWDIFLPAAALANLCYVVGTNTIGDGVRGGNCGHSKIISPYGEIIAEATQKDETLLLAEVDMDRVEVAREELPYLRDIKKGFSEGLI